MLQTLHIIVKGKVQGVYYRQSARNMARSLGITGTVENLDTGDVQIYATGPEEALQQMIAWCWQGPELAVVEDLKIEEQPLQDYTGFH